MSSQYDTTFGKLFKIGYLFIITIISSFIPLTKIMELINKNIRYLREREGLTQKELAAKLNVKVPVIGSYEEFRSIPPVPMATKIAEAFKIDLDSLVRMDLSKTSKTKSNKDKFLRGKDVLTITVDKANKENVELVTQKASAGYLSGYNDEEYIAELPKIFLPSLGNNRTFRAFEITGDSMLPLQAKSIVIGEFIQDLTEMQDGDCCVVVTKDQGIIYKRIYNFLFSSNMLLMVSDNPIYSPYLINLNDIIEVWKKRKIITDEIQLENNSLKGNEIASIILSFYDQLQKLKS